MVKFENGKIIGKLIQGAEIAQIDVPASGNTAFVKHIAFDPPFDNDPIVTLGENLPWTFSIDGLFRLGKNAVTKEGFDLMIYNKTSAAKSASVSWLAVDIKHLFGGGTP